MVGGPALLLGGPAARGTEEGLEQPPMQAVPLEEKFRMPLDAQEETLCRRFNGLHDAVLGDRAGDQRWCDVFDGLMMRTIYAHGDGLDDSAQQAAGGDADGMAELCRRVRLPMLERA